METLLDEKREERRHETARRLIRIRLGASIAWLCFTMAFGLGAGHVDYRDNLPFNGAYVIASVLLALGSRRCPQLLRRSWMSLPLLDFPMIFIIQYRGTPLAETPVGTAAFSVGILAILVVVAQLTMRARNVFITGAVAIVTEVLLLIRAGITVYGWFAALIVLSTISFAASAVVDEFSNLLGAVVTERTRIARELHDTLAQGLAGISLQLESVGSMLEESPEVARMHLERARALARSSLAEARRSVWSLRTPMLPVDLADSLADVVHGLTAETTATIRFSVSGERRRLTREAEENLLRIAQEAILNATKHARASVIDVELRFEHRSVQLAIRDDGIGIRPGPAGAEIAHFGLIGMYERASQVRGALNVRTRESGGTEVTLAVSKYA